MSVVSLGRVIFNYAMIVVTLVANRLVLPPRRQGLKFHNLRRG